MLKSEALAEQSGPPSPRNPVYRLRKDAVKAVFPCRSVQPPALPETAMDKK
jgi:hypothetical protein